MKKVSIVSTFILLVSLILAELPPMVLAADFVTGEGFRVVAKAYWEPKPNKKNNATFYLYTTDISGGQHTYTKDIGILQNTEENPAIFDKVIGLYEKPVSVEIKVDGAGYTDKVLILSYETTFNGEPVSNGWDRKDCQYAWDVPNVKIDTVPPSSQNISAITIDNYYESGTQPQMFAVSSLKLPSYPPPPEREGYRYKGIYSSATYRDNQYLDVNGQPVNAYTYFYGPTVYAIFDPITYSVTFDQQGGTGGPSKVTKTYGKALTLPSEVPTKTGYKFQGWNTRQNGSGKMYRAGDSYTANESATLYAQYTPNVYSIALNPDGGMINSGNITSYTYGVGATLPTDVARDGYTFLGWYNASGNKVTKILTTDTGDKSYTARWEETSYNAFVTVQKNDMIWMDTTKEIVLSDSISDIHSGQITGVSFEGVYTFSNIPPLKNYYVWAADSGGNFVYTNHTINMNSKNAQVKYYSVDLTAGTGIQSVSGDGIYLYGETTHIGAQLSPGYIWEKWSDDVTTQTGRLITADSQISLEALASAIPATPPTLRIQETELDYGYLNGNISVTATPAEGHTIERYQWIYLGTTPDMASGTILDNATDAVYEIPTGLDAGEYYYACKVTAKRADNNEVNETITPAVKVTVNRINAQISIAENQSKTFDNQVVTAGASGGDILYSYTGDGELTIKWYADNGGVRGGEIFPPTAAGTYWVGVAAVQGLNYNETAQVYQKFSINKKTPESSDFSYDFTTQNYNGSPIGVKITPKTGTAQLVVKYNSLEEIPSVPGTYAITIDVLNADNYKEIQGLSLGDFVISKIEPSVKLTSAKNPSVYEDETAFTANVAFTGGLTPTGTVTFRDGNNVLGTVNLKDGEAVLKKSDLNAAVHSITAQYNGDSIYMPETSQAILQAVNQRPVIFRIENTSHFYQSGVERKISIKDTGSLLTSNDFSVKYYSVDENEDKLTSASPVTKTIATGKYLYVIDFADTQSNYEITRRFEVSGTGLPDTTRYDNIGYMEIKAAQSAQQKPIFFKEGIVTVLATQDSYKNILINENSSMVTYQSSNDEIAQVDDTGVVTIKKAGAVTITATSKMEGTALVYASYVLNISKKLVTVKAADATQVFGEEWDKNTAVTCSDGLSVSDFDGTLSFDTAYSIGKKVGTYDILLKGLTSERYEITFLPGTLTVTPKVLTAADFTVTVSPKVFDDTVKADIFVTNISGIYGENSVTAEVSGGFTDKNAGERTVNYKITGLSGKDADNYALDGGSIQGTATQNIFAAEVSVICASSTTRTYDGKSQNVDLSAMANGAVFDRKNYTVKYNGADHAIDTGTYKVTIELADGYENNYIVRPFTSELIIKEAVQDVFSIENVPERVSYGDQFTVMAQGANGDISYRLNDGAPAMIDNFGNVTATGTGTVTITVTSTKEGYQPKTAVRTFTVYPRVLTAKAHAADRVYNTQNGVDVTIDLENIMTGDNITASGKGTMINSDAGADKLVYVSEVVLSGDKMDCYALSTETIQTTVNIEKAMIYGFNVTANNKKYDGSNSADAVVTQINGIFDSDKEQVSLIGAAAFCDENAEISKTVTYTALSLSGGRATNYQFADEAAKISETTADILPMGIVFQIGTASFRYDGEVKEVAISASDELGRVFRDYVIEYWKDDLELPAAPNEAGSYLVKVILNDNVNYTAARSAVEMTIVPVDQEQLSIIGLPSTIEYTDTFTIEAVGGNGDGEIEWSSDNASVLVDANGFVTVNGAVNERVTITAMKHGDENYTEKTASAVFIPSAKNTAFALDDLAQVYDGSEKEIRVMPDVADAVYEVTYNGSYDLPVNAGIYNVKVTAVGNYQGTAAAVLTIDKAKMSGLEVSQSDSIYGDTLENAVYDPAPEGAEVCITYSTVNGEKPIKAGNYVVTALYTGENYEPFTAKQEFTIEKKMLTVKANDASRKYGEANPVFTLSYDGFVYGENEQALLLEPIASSKADSSSEIAEYEITISGGRADNYSFNYDNTGKLRVLGANGGNFYITGANNRVTVGDIFTLHAYYDNAEPEVSWQSSDTNVATIDQNGVVTVHKQGAAVITAVITNPNYESGIQAEFHLTAEKKALNLTAIDLVKVYNTKRQDVTFVSDNADFVPCLFGDNKNIDITYTLTTDPNVTEPKQAGTYSVTYSINHPSYCGGGTVTMYINKAAVTVSAQDATKVYGQENPKYLITGLIGEDELDADYIAKVSDMFKITSEADDAGTRAAVGEYPIRIALKETADDVNYRFMISDTNGKLTVIKAALTIKIHDASRAFSEENADPKYEYIGFFNDETEVDLTEKPVFTYNKEITKETKAGSYADVITASGAQSNNYEITYNYASGDAADLQIMPLSVKASAGKAKSSYLTVNFDKRVPGLTAENFTVMSNDGTPVDLTSVSADSDYQTYTLKGAFKTGTAYTVSIMTDSNYMVEGSPLKIIPESSSLGSGGGGGSFGLPSYTITVIQTEGGAISPETTKISKNASAEFTITPDTGYQLKDVLVDGKSVGAVRAYHFEKVMANATITAVFERDNTAGLDSPDEWKNPFKDVQQDDWFYDAVKFVSENDFMNGIEPELFGPNIDITRGMFVTVLYRIEKEPEAGEAKFEDVRAADYYSSAVAWANEMGIVIGISDTMFAPNEKITREQMAVILFRYAKFKGSGPTGDWAVKMNYIDLSDISGYATEAVMFCTLRNIMSGRNDNEFNPQEPATRAEVAAVFMRMLQEVK